MSKDKDNDKDKSAENSKEKKTGYKSPPKEHQFKPGVSGNLLGRPKKKKSANELFYEHMHEKQSYVENGKTKKRPRIVLPYNVIYQGVMRGDMAFIKLYLELVKQAEGEIEMRCTDPMQMLVNPYFGDLEEAEQDIQIEEAIPPDLADEILKTAQKQGKSAEEVLKDLSQKHQKAISAKEKKPPE